MLTLCIMLIAPKNEITRNNARKTYTLPNIQLNLIVRIVGPKLKPIEQEIIKTKIRQCSCPKMSSQKISMIHETLLPFLDFLFYLLQ